MARETGSRSTPADASRRIGYDKPQGCFLRVFWMAVGNIALLAIAWLIFARDRFSLLDAAYWAVVALVIGARYLDIARFGGTAVDGTPVTMQHLRPYAVHLVLVAAALWVATHVLRYLF